MLIAIDYACYANCCSSDCFSLSNQGPCAQSVSKRLKTWLFSTFQADYFHSSLLKLVSEIPTLVIDCAIITLRWITNNFGRIFEILLLLRMMIYYLLSCTFPETKLTFWPYFWKRWNTITNVFEYYLLISNELVNSSDQVRIFWTKLLPIRPHINILYH
jgi:hypothetical protein